MPVPNGILGHNPELARRLLTSFLRWLRWLQLVSIVVQVSASTSVDPHRLSGAVVVFVGTFPIQWLLDAGRHSLAIRSLLAILYLSLLPGLSHSGLMSATTLILPATIPLSALLLGLRFGVGYAIVNLGTLAAFLFAQLHGWKPSAPPTSLPIWAFAEVVVAISVVVYQAIPANGLVSALGVSAEKQKELDRVIERLEAENRKLAAQVEIRTKGLREANESITRLSASLSHDLRTPLRSILGFTKILGEEKVPDPVHSQLGGIQTDISSLLLILEKTTINLRREHRP